MARTCIHNCQAIYSPLRWSGGGLVVAFLLIGSPWCGDHGGILVKAASLEAPQPPRGLMRSERTHRVKLAARDQPHALEAPLHSGHGMRSKLTRSARRHLASAHTLGSEGEHPRGITVAAGVTPTGAVLLAAASGHGQKQGHRLPWDSEDDSDDDSSMELGVGTAPLDSQEPPGAEAAAVTFAGQRGSQSGHQVLDDTDDGDDDEEQVGDFDQADLQEKVQEENEREDAEKDKKRRSVVAKTTSSTPAGNATSGTTITTSAITGTVTSSETTTEVSTTTTTTSSTSTTTTKQCSDGWFETC